MHVLSQSIHIAQTFKSLTKNKSPSLYPYPPFLEHSITMCYHNPLPVAPKTVWFFSPGAGRARMPDTPWPQQAVAGEIGKALVCVAQEQAVSRGCLLGDAAKTDWVQQPASRARGLSASHSHSGGLLSHSPSLLIAGRNGCLPVAETSLSATWGPRACWEHLCRCTLFPRTSVCQFDPVKACWTRSRFRTAGHHPGLDAIPHTPDPPTHRPEWLERQLELDPFLPYLGCRETGTPIYICISRP